jgi:nitrate/nitrite transporter NarK
VIFMVLFVVLFAASGIGNGSTFRTIGHLPRALSFSPGRGRVPTPRRGRVLREQAKRMSGRTRVRLKITGSCQPD